MRLVLISFSSQGAKTAEKLKNSLGREYEVHCTCSRELDCPVSEFVRDAFVGAEGILFVGAVGIAVRLIAPFVKDKKKDPAVVAVDELGHFAVSLLSGHLGGANALARQVAGILGSIPVITTATDLCGAFAVDLFAGKNRLSLSSMKLAKEISAAVLEGEKIGFFSEFPVDGPVPKSLTPGVRNRRNLTVAAKRQTDDAEQQGTLFLYPRTAVLGMGCRRGTSVEEIRTAASRALLSAGRSADDVLSLASIDLKKGEPGLVQFSRDLSVPFECFSAESLAQAGNGAIEFSRSEFVAQVTGVGTVCERAAVKAAQDWMEQLQMKEETPGLAVRKQICGSVTAAVALIPAWRILTF